MKRTIKNPHWTNNARTIMSAEFHYEDGRVVTAVINCGDINNPDWVEINNKFSQQELEENTAKAIQRQSQQQQAERRKIEAQKEKERQEKLFALKLQAFETDFVKETTNRKLKSAIRRAKTDFEVYALTAALILEDINKIADAPPSE